MIAMLPPDLPANASVQPEELSRIAHWKHRVTLSLGQILGLLDLVEDVATPTERDALAASLAAIRAGIEPVRQQLEALLNQPSDESLDGRSQRVATAVSRAVDEITVAYRECVEIAATVASEGLRADLLGLSESMVRLRHAVDSLRRETDAPKSGPQLIVQNEQSSGTMTPFAPDHGHSGAKLLLVDDDRINLKVIGRRLERMGFVVVTADRGIAGLELLEYTEVDLVMLDIMMPELDGFATLERIRSQDRLRNLPVIMLTALDDAETTARCLANGADDYVSKPFDETVLRARINVALDRKRLREKEGKLMERVRSEKNVSEQLLHSILPQPIANRLREGEEQLVDRFTAASVVFVDIVGFTRFSSTHEPEETVSLLNDLFSRFDRLVELHGLEKIKTIGDAYLAVAGVPEMVADHAPRAARMALAVHQSMENFNAKYGIRWSVRVGICSGPLVAGIIGSRKFAYDLWGDTVNVASRLESKAQPDQTYISAQTAELLDEEFAVEKLPPMELHNRGKLRAYRLLSSAQLGSIRETEPRFG
jgi:adenylate cyclase